ncbi:hypothetical protein HRbin39_00074 [bacterium HR39]|nr:hypothetical protein HRbin39_00074 [bacterium HR39]
MRTFVLALALSVPLVLPAAAEEAAKPEPARTAVFAPGFFTEVHAPTVLLYRYELTSELMKEPYVSRVRVEVRGERPDGTKEVWLDMFDGPNHRLFGPVPAEDQNPVILALLQKDVATMRNLAGGAQGYFQQQIRLAFGRPPAEREEVTVEIDGRAVPAERVRLLPFRDDPAIVRFSKFRDKRYDFVVSKEVPGGLYRMVIEIPDPEDPEKPVLRETLTFLRALSGAPASGS